MSNGLYWIDWGIIVAYAVSTIATLLSTISYLSMPGEAAGKRQVSLVGLLLYPVIFLVVSYLAGV